MTLYNEYTLCCFTTASANFECVTESVITSLRQLQGINCVCGGGGGVSMDNDYDGVVTHTHNTIVRIVS